MATEKRTAETIARREDLEDLKKSGRRRRMATENRAAETISKKEDFGDLNKSLMDIGIMSFIGLAFMLSTFLYPGISIRGQIMCWQAAIVFFFAAGMLIVRWFPLFLRWLSYEGKKDKPE